jgi:hypothetical protein
MRISPRILTHSPPRHEETEKSRVRFRSATQLCPRGTKSLEFEHFEGRRSSRRGTPRRCRPIPLGTGRLRLAEAHAVGGGAKRKENSGSQFRKMAIVAADPRQIPPLSKSELGQHRGVFFSLVHCRTPPIEVSPSRQKRMRNIRRSPRPESETCYWWLIRIARLPGD